MLFNSHTFLLFFAVVLVLYQLPVSWRSKKLQLLVASYLFYAAWNPPFVLLLWLSTIVDWQAAKIIDRASGPWQRRFGLSVSLLTNLGLLAFFKYGNFALENFQFVLSSLGVYYQPPGLDIILPVGISFYTFQTLSYSLDVYRGKMRAWNSFLDFALYVTFFPQLVAGPIVRAVDFLPQCIQPRRVTSRAVSWGFNLLLIGLFQKVVFADGLLAPIVDRVFQMDVVDPVTAWIGTLAFAGQIYCDFAGYSTCAIGAAMCLGFALPDNFRFPYAAVGFSDFWRRWHISLSTWLRDYLYISLGGNRVGATRTHVNLMLTMLIGGLWHGASWTFVAWGGLHGLYLVAERSLQSRAFAANPLWQQPPVRLVLAGITFFLVCLSWTLFRSGSLAQGFEMLSAMLLLDGGSMSVRLDRWNIMVGGGLVGAIVASHWFMRERTLESVFERLPLLVWSGVNGLMLIAILMMPSDDRAFIYFQF